MVLLNALSVPTMLSSVNVALPAMARALDLNAVVVSWVPTSFLLASAALLITFGRLADMFGRKRIFMIGTAALVLTSVLAATATNGFEIIVYRTLQGVAASMLYATHVAIITSVYPPAERGKVVGLIVSVIYIGLTLGPLLGGWLVSWYGWQAAFMVHVPLCLVAFAYGLTVVKGEWHGEHRGAFDFSGAILYVAAMSAVMLGISFLPKMLGVGLLVAGGLGMYGFFLHQLRQEDPLFDVSLFFENRIFTMSCLASLIMYTATFANIVLISLYLQYLKGFDVQTAGFIMMVQPLVMAVVSPFAGKVSDQVEPRLIASAGMAITAIGQACLATMAPDTPVSAIAIYLAMSGFGFALFSSPNVNAIMGSVDRARYGAAASSLATMRVVGQMTSMAIMSLAFAVLLGPVAITDSNLPVLERALSFSFSIAAALCMPGIYLSLARGRVHQPA